jgi:hypothetical protein
MTQSPYLARFWYTTKCLGGGLGIDGPAGMYLLIMCPEGGRRLRQIPKKTRRDEEHGWCMKSATPSELRGEVVIGLTFEEEIAAVVTLSMHGGSCSYAKEKC